MKKFLTRFRILIRIYDRLFFLKGYTLEYLTFLYKYLRSFFEARPQKILLIMTFGIGDILRTLPVIKKLNKRYPRASIEYLTQTQYRTLLEHNPFITRMLFQEDKKEILQQNYDLVINFQLFDNSIFVRELMPQIKYKKVLGSHFDNKGCYRHINDLYARNWVEEFCHIALVSYCREDTENSRIYLPQDWQDKLRQLYRQFGIDENEIYIGIHLGADDTLEAKLWYRNYSVKFLRSLIENLIKDYGIILTGRSIERRKDEQDELRKMISDLPSVVNLVDKLSLEEFILIIRRCSCYISSDTGPLHIAKALDTPLVALFGPSSGKREIGPYRFAERYAILQSEFRCSPCGWRISKDCLENRRSVCMERFSIEKIAGEVKRLIGIDRRL